MSEGACLRRHAEKKVVEEKTQPEEVEEDKVNLWVKYTQFINEIGASYCQDVANFNPIVLQQQLKVLADNFPYKHTPMPVPQEIPQGRQ
jgi:arginyl-tRNA--protein-N-Asp/Glu arginylyltransferase